MPRGKPMKKVEPPYAIFKVEDYCDFTGKTKSYWRIRDNKTGVLRKELFKTRVNAQKFLVLEGFVASLEEVVGIKEEGEKDA